MANYPSELVFSNGSIAIPRSGIRPDYASNGDLRTRLMHSRDRNDFRLVHYLVNGATKAILDSFYSANKGLEITLSWLDGSNYNCMFVDGPKYSAIGAGLYNVVVDLSEKDV